MPKIKTNRMASKKFKRTASGRFKRAQARTSHNTGKMSAKRKRNLRQRKMVHSANERHVSGLLAGQA